ncbi:hypothetical protein GCM10007939_20950 [Amylibacter marinus]|uniref:asparagine synthase (glutamine-hydrolyzing) n=1 Tax=Amylibacter marinus TaxID=1475483 RepID=A0ABQ5VWY1_9RHOB|nr:asparagine synthase-related protein [Amylibacter marinus]GLQ35812.1 hypothetical protein GCM10007939_20950 [Amylibacter marinus]
MHSAAISGALVFGAGDAQGGDGLMLGGCRLVTNPALVDMGQVFTHLHRAKGQELLVAVFGRICHWPDLSDADLRGANQAQLVAQAYGEGLGFLPALAGDFAIVIWDNIAQRLLLISDHLGTRPLFYLDQGNAVYFASAIADLLPHCVDRDCLYTPKVLDFLHGANTSDPRREIIDEIRSLHMGEYVEFHAGQGAKVTPYWHPNDAPVQRGKSDAELISELQDLLRLSVQQRVPHDIQLALHISGGLDSSAVAAIAGPYAKQQGLKRPIGVSWLPDADTPDQRGPDHAYCALAAQTYDVDLSWAGIKACDQEAFFALDPCVGNSTSTLLLEIGAQRALKDDAPRLVLSGWGGDEVISNPGRSKWRGRVPGWMRSLRHAPRALFSRRSERGNNSFLTPSYLAQFRAQEQAMPGLRDGTARRRQILRLTLGGIQERMRSWSSYFADQRVQFAYPLLDQRLVSFVLGLPPHLFTSETGLRRNVIRLATSGILVDKLRLRNDKEEPARFDDSARAGREIAPEFLARLDAGAFDPARAAFLDMDRLRQGLKDQVAGQKTQFGKISNALALILQSRP